MCCHGLEDMAIQGDVSFARKEKSATRLHRVDVNKHKIDDHCGLVGSPASLKRIQEQQQRQQQKISKTKVLNKNSYLNYAALIQVSVKWTLCTVKEEIPFQYSRNFHRRLENSLLHNRGKFHPGGCINESNGVPLLAFWPFGLTLSHRGITYSVVANQSEKHAICRLNIK